MIFRLHNDDNGENLAGHHSRTGAFTTFGAAQLGIHAVQGLGTLADGAAAEAIGAPVAVGLAGVAVGLAGLVGLTAATMFVMNWAQLRARLIQAQQAEAEATGTGP